MRIILIRHGETLSNVAGKLDTALPGAELTELGVEQAQALPQRVAHLDFDAIVCSGTARTLATGAPLANARGLEMGVDERFVEIQAGSAELSTHEWDWKTYVDVISAWWAGDLDARQPDAEDGNEFLERWDAGLAALAQHEQVAVIVHGGAMRTWAFIRCDNVDVATAAAPMPNTGYIVVDGEPGAWKVTNWNGTELSLEPAVRDGDGPKFAATEPR